MQEEVKDLLKSIIINGGVLDITMLNTAYRLLTEMEKSGGSSWDYLTPESREIGAA